MGLGTIPATQKALERPGLRVSYLDLVELYEAFAFFFQAEDGIRDGHVTGVQTCALPIYVPSHRFYPVTPFARQASERMTSLAQARQTRLAEPRPAYSRASPCGWPDRCLDGCLCGCPGMARDPTLVMIGRTYLARAGCFGGT